ncbi:MAG: pyridoxal phosphate-dependent aminotransferase [Anaerotignum sp.]
MLAKRILNMTPSATSELLGKVADMRAKGEDIIAFSAGEPDLQTPQPIIDACKRALEEGKTKYTAVAGIANLRKAVCEKLERDNQVIYTPEQICISTGAKQALFNAVMALCDEGDEIIIPTPCWVSYVEMVNLAQGTPVLVSTKEDFSLDLEKIEGAISEKTKAIIINTPNNPTGACYDEVSLRALAELAVKYDFYVIADEIYEKLVYDGNRHVSIASFSEEIYQRTIIINGFSKSHSMTGWRIGYAAAPKEITKGITSLQGHTTSNSTSFVQWAAVEALRSCDASVEEMRKEFMKRRDYLYDKLCGIPGVTCVKPGGAFYLMPDISAYFGKTDGEKVIQTSADFCNYILEKGKVAVVPGSAFGMPETVRFAYTESMERIAEGVERFAEALKKLK